MIIPMKHLRHILVLICLIVVATAAPGAAVTLVEKSTGFSAIDWEEGHTELEFADANGDGHLDLLSVGDHGNPHVNSTEHGLICYLGDGAGAWSAHQYGNFGYGGVGLGDLNGDGLLDAAFGIHHDWPSSGLGSKLMGAALGDGTGSAWTAWDAGMPAAGETWGMFATDLADFDGDGDLDVVCQSFGGSNGIRLYGNNGDGTWTPMPGLPGGSVAYTLETGDFNADGHLDFCGTRSTGSVYLGDGAGGFTLHQSGLATGIYSVDVGDFDGDGRDDLLIDHGAVGVKAWRLDPGSEVWQEHSSGLPTTNVEMVQFGDLNGDGHLDVVTYTAPTGRCYLSDGSGAWVADATWTMPSPGSGAALRVDGDVDHDGREDIAVLATKSGFPFYRNQLRVYSPWQPPAALTARVTAPAGGETLRLGSVREIRWACAVPAGSGPATVDIHLSTAGPDGPWAPIALQVPDSGRHQWTVAGTPSGEAHIRVRCSTGDAEVLAVSAAPFTLAGDPASAVTGPESAALSLAMHPNPSSGDTRVHWSRPLRREGALEVFDVRGRLVHRVALTAGQVGHDWLAEGQLPAGMYLVVLRTGDARVTGKLILR